MTRFFRFGFFVLISCMVPQTVAAQNKPSGSSMTTGSCSPAISGSINVFTIKCSGLSKEQGRQLVTLLNRILADQLDIRAATKKLEEAASTLQSYGAPTHGELLPASDPDPPILAPDCVVPPESFKIFVGDGVVYSPHLPVNAFKAGNRDFVSIEALGDGIGVDAIASAPDGKLLVQMEKNRFVASGNTFDRRLSADHSTLEVIDEYGNQALYVKYLSPRSVRVMGRFFTGRVPVIIGEKSITSGSLTTHGMCASSLYGAIFN